MNDISKIKHQIVTKASDDGTFRVGDHITYNDEGFVTCREAMGWIEPSDIKAATKGMVSIPDVEWYENKKARLLAELAELDSIGGIGNASV